MEATATTDTTRSAVPRTWRSLLTGGWHCSSWVVATAVLLILVFCNVPGQLVTLPVDQPEAFWGQGHRYEHGWPWTWATRHGETWVLQLRKPEDVNCWTFWADNPEFDSSALAWNFGSIVIVTMASSGAFELWRRARLHLCQLHLRDLLAIVLVVSLVGAWYDAAQRRYAHELEICGPPFVEGRISWARREPIHGIQWYLKTSGGITWLRRLVGDQRFQFLDRVIAAEVEPAGLAWVSQLPEVGAVVIEGDVAGEELVHLQSLPLLEYLSIRRRAISTWRQRLEHSRPRLRLPPLPQVYELKVSEMDVEGLANLPSLEFIEWWSEPIDEPLFRQLAALPNLQYVEFHQCALVDEGLTQLKSNPRLTQLCFSMVSMPPDHFEPLGQLAQLEHLDLISCRFDEPGQIRHLASLSQLESLDLSGTNVDDGSLRHLIDLPNLNELDLGGTDVTNGAITHLAKMKHLRELRLAGTFDDQDVARLQAALPACQLVRPPNPMGPVSAKAVAP